NRGRGGLVFRVDLRHCGPAVRIELFARINDRADRSSFALASLFDDRSNRVVERLTRRGQLLGIGRRSFWPQNVTGAIDQFLTRQQWSPGSAARWRQHMRALRDVVVRFDPRRLRIVLRRDRIGKLAEIVGGGISLNRLSVLEVVAAGI